MNTQKIADLRKYTLSHDWACNFPNNNTWITNDNKLSLIEARRAMKKITNSRYWGNDIFHVVIREANGEMRIILEQQI